MAGVQIHVDVDDRELQRTLGALLARARDLRPAMEEIGAMLLASSQQRFQEERGPDGAPWAPLAESTREKRVGGRRSRQRGSANILRVKGLLAGSLTYLAGSRDVQVGTNKRYAALHQLGGTPGMAPGPAAVPARPFLGVSADDEREIGQILLDHLESA